MLGCFVAVVLGVTLAFDLSGRATRASGREDIVFASMWAPGEVQEAAYRSLFAQFERRYPRYRVVPRWEGRWVLATIRPRLLTRTEIPDLVNDHMDQAAILIREGHLQRLDARLDTMPHPDVSGRRLRDALLPQFRKRAHYRGIPTQGSQSQGAQSQSRRLGHQAPPAPGTYLLPSNLWLRLVFYNRVHYRELGLKEPRYWSDLLENCRRLREAGHTPFTAAPSVYNNYWADALLASTVGTEGLLNTLNGHSRWDGDPRYRAVFEAIADLHQPGWFTEGWSAGHSLVTQEEFVRGRATHVMEATWIYRSMRNYRLDPKRIEVGAFAIPLLGSRYLPAIDESTDARAPVVNSEAPGYGLMKKARNPDGAAALLSFLSQRESASLLARATTDLPTVDGARWSSQLAFLKPQVEGAWDIQDEGIRLVAPKWYKTAFQDHFDRFFRHAAKSDPRTVSAREFLKQLEQRTNRYRRSGGEGSR